MCKVKWFGQDSTRSIPALIAIKSGWAEFQSSIIVDWFFPMVKPVGESPHYCLEQVLPFNTWFGPFEPFPYLNVLSI